MVIGTDYTGSCQSNYNAINTTTAPYIYIYIDYKYIFLKMYIQCFIFFFSFQLLSELNDSKPSLIYSIKMYCAGCFYDLFSINFK